jgi:hypothetical protein
VPHLINNASIRLALDKVVGSIALRSVMAVYIVLESQVEELSVVACLVAPT